MFAPSVVISLKALSLSSALSALTLKVCTQTVNDLLRHTLSLADAELLGEVVTDSTDRKSVV